MLPSVRPLARSSTAGLHGSSRSGSRSRWHTRSTVLQPGCPDPVSPTVAPCPPCARPTPRWPRRAYAATAGALYVPPLTSRAQTMRAILLARAVVTSMRGLRASIRASHEPAAAPRRLGSVEVQLFPVKIPCFKLVMDRYVLTDAQWAKMEPHCRGKKSDPGRSGADNRRFVEAILWIARTGSPWRDLPPLFGRWNTVFKRYRDWVRADVFERLFDAASDEPDMEYAMVDATIVKVHRHGQGAKGGLRAKPSAAPKAA